MTSRAEKLKEPAPAVVERAARLGERGDFRHAAALLEKALREAGRKAEDQSLLVFELERLSRIRRDFPYSESALFQSLKEALRGLTKEEFECWVREGRFDSRIIDGKCWYMGSSVSNLFFRYPQLEARRIPRKDFRTLEKMRLEAVDSIDAAVRAAGCPYVVPVSLHVTARLTIKKGVIDGDETIRVWLPIPRESASQRNVTVLGSVPFAGPIEDGLSPIRSIYFEQKPSKAPALDFKVDYSYESYAVKFRIDPAKFVPCDARDSGLVPFLKESPHVVFTPAMKALSARIAGAETNALARAKLYYHWIGEDIKYSYAVEYSTIRNIGEYCMSRGYGDCGQAALLFMTLCRMDGIPARWQSGWDLFPGAMIIHDWVEIYAAPWGWIPVDPFMSIFSNRESKSLTVEEQGRIRDFYFGGLDQHRMCANSDHCQPLCPAKKWLRSDPVDFQRGEVETDRRNIYFDQFTYQLEVRSDFK